jgi:predicted dehydrogenase
VAEAIATGAPAPVMVSEAVAALEVIESAFVSAAESRSVRIG